METLINLIVNNGTAVVIVGYFIFKDNKFNNKLVETLTEVTVTLKDVVTTLNGVVATLNSITSINERGNTNEESK